MTRHRGACWFETFDLRLILVSASTREYEYSVKAQVRVVVYMGHDVRDPGTNTRVNKYSYLKYYDASISAQRITLDPN